jgi:hypothetical protein
MLAWLAGCAEPCGRGTRERDGVCVAERAAPGPTCGEGTVRRGAECVALEGVEVAMPFAAGTEVRVLQGPFGGFSHEDELRFAVDFGVPEGTVVTALRAGRVVSLREDSDQGCPEPECQAYANALTVDHGDGTIAHYLHLRQDGVDVEVGELVGRGQPIARSGNTGWTTTPHLHVHVRDPLGQSLPLWFGEAGGEVYGGGTFVSATTPEPPPDALDWSTCPPDLFRWLGVRLGPGVPCVAAHRDTDHEVSGEVLVEGAAAVLGTFDTLTDAWTFQCHDAPDGEFSAVARWDSGTYGHRVYAMAAAADPETCATFQSWSVSVPLVLFPP